MVANGLSSTVHYDIVKAAIAKNSTSSVHPVNESELMNNNHGTGMTNGLDHPLRNDIPSVPVMPLNSSGYSRSSKLASGMGEVHYANASSIMLNGRSTITNDVIRHTNGVGACVVVDHGVNHTSGEIIRCSNSVRISSTDIIRPSVGATVQPILEYEHSPINRNLSSKFAANQREHLISTNPSTALASTANQREHFISTNHNTALASTANQCEQFISTNHNTALVATTNQHEAVQPTLANQSSAACRVESQQCSSGSADDLLRAAAAAGHIDEVIALLSKGAQVTPDETGHAPLHRAAAEGHVDVVQQLIQRGANVSTQDSSNGNTALHEAAWQGFSGTVRCLLEAGASMTVCNRGGFTPLHLACQNGHNQTCRALLLAGCQPDVRNSYGDTPLHTSARYGHAGVMRILISGHANVSQQNKNGDSPLHIAAAMGRRKLTRILLEGGVDSSLKNKQEESALEIATRKQHADIISLISNPPPVSKSIARRREQKRSKADSGSSSREGSGKTGDKKKRAPRVHFESKSKPVVHGGDRPDSATNKDGVGWSPYGCFSPPDVSDFPQPRLETLPKEPLGKGEQYYLDLAGNIRKGPVGEGYTCYCAPFFQHVETKLDRDKRELIAHIDTNHNKLDRKIAQLERRTRSHLTGLNDVVRGRLSRERLDCCERAKRAALRTQAELEQRHRAHARTVKDDLTAYLECRLQQLSVRGSGAGGRRQPIAGSGSASGGGSGVSISASRLQKSRSAELLTDLSDEDLTTTQPSYTHRGSHGAVTGSKGGLRVLDSRPLHLASSSKSSQASTGGQRVGYSIDTAVPNPGQLSHYSRPSVSLTAAALTNQNTHHNTEVSDCRLPLGSMNGHDRIPRRCTDSQLGEIVAGGLSGRQQVSLAISGSSGSDDSHYVAMSRSRGNSATVGNVSALNNPTSNAAGIISTKSGNQALAAALTTTAANNLPGQQLLHRQFHPLDSHEEGGSSDQHNDSGYSTRIYAGSSSQGPSPPLSGVPTEEDSISNQSAVLPAMSSRARANELTSHLNCIAEDIAQLQPVVGLKSSLV